MKIRGEEGPRPRYRWAILFAALCAFVAFAFALQVAPPLILSIKVEFNILSDAEAALLMSLVLLPGIFLSLPAGSIVGRYGIRQVGFMSLVCVVLGSLVTATANSFLTLLVGRLIVGVGGTFVLIMTPAIIAQWFMSEELGKAMGIFGVNMPLAMIIAFPSASALLAYGWRLPFYVSVGVGIGATAVFTAIAKEGPFAEHKRITNVREAVASSEIWKLGIVWLFFNAATLSFTTWAPTLFEKFQNMSKVQGSFFASLLSWAAIFCVPIFGHLSDRMGKRKAFILLGHLFITFALVASAFASNLTLVASILALGVAAAMTPPIVSALPPEILGTSLASLGFGITATCTNIGATLAQPSIGFILDTTQSYTPCLLGMAAFSAIGAILAYTLKTN